MVGLASIVRSSAAVLLLASLAACGEGEVATDAELAAPPETRTAEAPAPESGGGGSGAFGGGGGGPGLRGAINAAQSLEGRIAEQQNRTIAEGNEDG